MSTNGRAVPFGNPDTFLQNVLESSTEYSIIAADPQGKILLWNEGARRIYGYAPEEIIGKDSRVIHPPTPPWPAPSTLSLRPRPPRASGRA